MAPRVSTKPLVDGALRASSRPRCSFPLASKRIVQFPSQHVPSASTLARSYTCTSCRHQSQRQAERDGAHNHARELQKSTPPAPHSSGSSPTPQRRLPRWAETPAAMKAPFSMHKNDPANRFPVNEDPARLDRAYASVFGEGGEQLLSEEVKWLAVTHKSFDQGRRGFNDRLAFLGKRIVDLQTSLAVLAQPAAQADVAARQERMETVARPDGSKIEAEVDEFGREVFSHPAVDILPKLRREVQADYTASERISLMAKDFGLEGVVRWKPRRATALLWSGHSAVLAQALYAMIGAVALEKGGDVAVKAVRARILPRLGLKI